MTKSRIGLSALALSLALLALSSTAYAAKPPTEAQMVELVGGKDSGWAPAIFKDLKKGMTPDEAKAVFPKMKKVSKFGFADVPVKAPGVKKLVLYFAKDKETGERNALQSARIEFVPALTKNEDWFKLMLKVTQDKWGPIRKPEESIAKRIITWVGPKYRTAQFSKIGKQFQLTFNP